MPDDPRVLSELGWAAFQAGDYVKARSTLERSVRLAARTQEKAASLYNLGRVEEASGRRDLAATKYRASLALRENRIVKERLLALQDEKAGLLRVAEPTDERFCTAPVPLLEVCACVLPNVSARDGAKATKCEVLEKAPLLGFRLLRLSGTYSYPVSLFLLESRESGWSVLGQLDSLDDPGRSVFEPTTAGSLSVAGRRVLTFITRVSEHHESLGSKDGYNADRETETVCIADPVGTPVRCVLRVAIASTYKHYLLFGEMTEEERAWAEKNWNEDSDTNRDDRLRIDIGEDGIAQVVLEKGDATEYQELLGPHRLW